MEKKGKEQLKELYRFQKFLGIKKHTPKCLNTRPNSSFDYHCRYPIIRRLINLLKYEFRKNKRAYYLTKRALHIDYIFQWFNRRI